MGSLIHHYEKNIQGVHILGNTTAPQFTLGITCLVHGNETAGLEIANQLIYEYSNTQLSTIRLIFIAVNIAAYDQGSRQIDKDMNRIRTESTISNYEKQRYTETIGFLDMCDTVIDLHTTSYPSGTIAICDTTHIGHVQQHIICDHYIHTGLGTSSAYIAKYVANGGIGIGLECGTHTSAESVTFGIHTIQSYIQHYRYHPYIRNIHNKPIKKNTYSFFKEIIPLHDGFSFSKSYRNFDCIQHGEIFAHDTSMTYSNTSNKELYIGFMSNDLQKDMSAGFLLEKNLGC